MKNLASVIRLTAVLGAFAIAIGLSPAKALTLSFSYSPNETKSVQDGSADDRSDAVGVVRYADVLRFDSATSFFVDVTASVSKGDTSAFFSIFGLATAVSGTQ